MRRRRRGIRMLNDLEWKLIVSPFLARYFGVNSICDVDVAGNNYGDGDGAASDNSLTSLLLSSTDSPVIKVGSFLLTSTSPIVHVGCHRSD